jgi:predicted nuclease of restriction endonuclease-like RecB superfamily
VAADTLIFPDSALQHRSDPTRRWLLEIAGFWTLDYVTRKLALYRSARLPSLILCIDGSGTARRPTFRRALASSDIGGWIRLPFCVRSK